MSSKDQAKTGLGLGAQRVEIIACAKRHKFKRIDGFFVDAAVSGGKSFKSRPKFSKLLAVIKPGDVILVQKRDRLGRDFYEMTKLSRDMENKNIWVLSAKGEGTEDNSPNSILQRRISDALSEHERKVVGERTKAALAIKKAKGERIGRLLYGWKRVGGKVVPDDAERRVVNAVFRWRRAGWAYRQIAIELWDRGYKSRRGHCLSISQICSIIKRYGIKKREQVD